MTETPFRGGAKRSARSPSSGSLPDANAGETRGVASSSLVGTSVGVTAGETASFSGSGEGVDVRGIAPADRSQPSALSPEPVSLLLRMQINAAHNAAGYVLCWAGQHIDAPPEADHLAIGRAAETIVHHAAYLRVALESLERAIARATPGGDTPTDATAEEND